MTMVLRVTVPAIAAGLLLTGCGGSSGTTTTPASLAAATSSAATPSAAASTATSTGSATPASTGSASTTPAGYKPFTDTANGYRLALPAGYIHITSKAQLAEVFKGTQASTERAGISQQLLNKSLKMIAIKPGAGESINVVVTSAGGLTADELPAIEPALKKEVAKLGAKTVAFKKATLGGEPALHAVYTSHLQGRDVPTIQYITVHDDKAYTLTFSALSGGTSKVEKLTAASFQFS